MADASETLIQKLERTRAGYKDELEWHRFLLCAYSGGGGFQGKVRQPASGYWGAAAEVYAQGPAFRTGSSVSNRDTYLDRYPREDIPKFSQRIDVSHYPNYVEPLTDLKISHLLRRDLTFTDQPEKVKEWREEGAGGPVAYEEQRRGIILRAAILGWCPVLVDMPPAERADQAAAAGDAPALTQAQANELGLTPRLIPLFPANILDYGVDDTGELLWAKVWTCRYDQPDPLEPSTKIHTYTLWFRDRAVVYTVIERNGQREVTAGREYSHPFKAVPLAILRHKPSEDGDPVQGLPMHGQVSTEARRLFNLTSELDEHLRSQVFAVLVMVGRPGPEDTKDVTIGTDNALTLDFNATKEHYYLAPPATVAATLETRIYNTVREIYRIGRVEFAHPTGQVATGVARAYEFQATNRALADYAKQIALWEHQVDTLAGRGLGESDENLAKEDVAAPTDFDVDDLNAELKRALDAVNLKLGRTAEKLLKMKLVDGLLPNLPSDKRKEIETELDEAADEAEAAAAALRDSFENGDADPNADPEADPTLDGPPPPMPGKQPPPKQPPAGGP